MALVLQVHNYDGLAVLVQYVEVQRHARLVGQAGKFCPPIHVGGNLEIEVMKAAEPIAKFYADVGLVNRLERAVGDRDIHRAVSALPIHHGHLVRLWRRYLLAKRAYPYQKQERLYGDESKPAPHG